MPAPYSMDLRTRLVKWCLSGAGTVREAAVHFRVGEATASRWVARHRRTGSVEAKPMCGSRGSRVLTEERLEAIRRFVAEEPSLTLDAIAGRVAEEDGAPAITLSAVSRALRKLGFTRKKTLPGSTRWTHRA